MSTLKTISISLRTLLKSKQRFWFWFWWPIKFLWLPVATRLAITSTKPFLIGKILLILDGAACRHCRQIPEHVVLGHWCFWHNNYLCMYLRNHHMVPSIWTTERGQTNDSFLQVSLLLAHNYYIRPPKSMDGKKNGKECLPSPQTLETLPPP